MIEEYRMALWGVKDIISDYARTDYAGPYVKKCLTRLRVLSEASGKQGPEKFLRKVVEVSDVLDALYYPSTGYRRLHFSESTESLYKIETQRLKDIKQLGAVPIFERLDEERVRKSVLYPSVDPLLRFTKAIKVMEPLLLLKGDGFRIVAEAKNIESIKPIHTLEPAGKVLRYFDSYAEADRAAPQFVGKLIKLQKLITTECLANGIDREVRLLNPESGMEALVAIEYLNEEVERLQELYIKLITWRIT